jgi:glucose-1-phosphate cytidylyltransferase
MGMKVVILAGGFGTRISEESHLRPKPMIEIGGQPILWHIMKYYASFGYDEFIICAGYKQQIIKEYFANYYLHRCDVTFDFADGGKVTVHNNVSEPWKVTVIDTGLNTMTGGRIKRIAPYVGDEPFMLTYGDGVADIDLDALVAFHEANGKTATITGVNVTQRFGVLDIDEAGAINEFREKKKDDGGVINGGYMVLEPAVFDYIDGDTTVFEQDPLNRLAEEGQLDAYRHAGFWQCMDTQREKQKLEELIASGEAPWVRW